MTKAVYAVAKYVPDQLRFEPRNIGVVVIGKDGAAARFIGEDQSGKLDLRRVPPDLFNDRQVYAEWHRFWRRHARPCPGDDLRSALAPLLTESRGAFVMWDGGEFATDLVIDQSIADELFSKLVEPWAAPALLDSAQSAAPAKPLSVRLFRDIRNAFAEVGILETDQGGSLFAKHSIRIEDTVSGTLPVPHRPRFSQLNGKLWVMEHVDFTEADDEEIREHSLYATYMLEDIQRAHTREQGATKKVELIAIIKRDVDENRESQRYGLAALEKVPSLRFVAWDEISERERFLAERVAVAGIPGR